MTVPVNGQGPAVVQPQPSPMTWNYQIADLQTPLGAQKVVLVQIANVAGVFVAFLEPQAAMEVGGKIRAMGKRAASGLFLPDSIGLTADPSDDEVEQ